ncbi:hypothetical protein P1J78_12265 [Psychromarinibacter sp. C21-152]|uniref:Uncharacterized protein n=1 Tax=Psychromarinibacter sediminicola TaxID=3033385 RepID=A0AAE3TAD6_9RHOB|nr:hypothetical protein [Psychromarinibacter sediminicola]MDF0601510.1 hypothetical protein [Psychromarinibacter sediminicola]
MRTRLSILIDEAQSVLPPRAQDELADLVEAFTARHSAEPDLSVEQATELRRRMQDSFAAAPQAEVDAFFKRVLG